MYLENIYSPADVKKLSEKELNELGGRNPCSTPAKIK